MHIGPIILATIALIAAPGCGGGETPDGGAGTPYATGPREAPKPLVRKTGVDPALLEIARLEDDKERSSGRLAELLTTHAVAAVRRAAAMALGHIHHPDDAPTLALAYGDDDTEVAVAAIFATGLLHEGKRKAAAGPLVALLNHAQERIRAAAVESLGRIADVSVASQVHGLLRDDAPTVRGEAALASWRLIAGTTKIPELKEDATDEEREAHAEATRARVQVHLVTMPLARAADAENDDEARWLMLFALQGLRREKARWDGATPPELLVAERAELEVLVTKWQGDTDPRTRGAAAMLAGRLLRKDAGALASRGFQDRDWTVRLNAIRACSIGPAKGVLGTIRSLAATDAHPLVRVAAMGFIGARGDEGSADLVRDLLRSDIPSIRRKALGVWAELRGPAGLAEIEPFFAHADVYTRSAAIQAAGATITEDAPDGHADIVAELLGARFATGGLLEQASVMDALGKLPVGLAGDLLERGLAVDELEVRWSAGEVIKKRAKEIREAGRDLVPAMLAAWERSSAARLFEVRQKLLEALVALEDDRAKPVLAAGLKDPHRAVREVAAKGLEKLTGEAVEVGGGPDPRGPGRPSAEEARSLDLPRRLRFVTTKGEMVIELFVEDAPLHSYNIVKLARDGFYDGLNFHRVVPGFVIQGGCPRGTGSGDPGYTINNEVNMHRYRHGTLGMPDSGLDTGGCQIFINHVPWPSLDGRYTVFGQVVEGLDVIDRIEVGDKILRATCE